MRLNKIEEKLYDLLIKENKEVVISISGEWGIGKTYFWNNFIKDYKEKELKYKQIAYVSLFGINSLNDIRTSILLQVSPTKKKLSWVDKKIITPLKNVKSSLKLDDLSMSFGFDALGSIFTLLTSGDFENVIVCFDDFERISSNINLKDVLGLISELKEQKKCKVVMILNEKELGKLTDIEKKPYSEIFSLYKEKIIDYDFVFEPTLEENIKIATEKSGFRFKQETILRNLQNFNIKNIRVLEQIFRKLKKFEFIIDESYHDNVLNDFLNTAFIVLEFITKDGKKVEDYLKEKKKYDVSSMSDDEFKEYFSQQNYKENIFSSIDDLIENIILEFLEKDTIDSKKLIEILNEKNEHTNWYEIQSDINQKWRKVYTDFNYSRETFAKEINQIFEDNKENIHNIVNFEQLFVYLEFIKNIPFEINKDTEELMIKNYIDKYDSFDNEIEKFVNKNYQSLNSYLKEKRDKKLIEDITLDSVNLTLKKVKQGFSREDEYILDNISSKKYKSFILESSSFSENIISFLFSRYNSDNNFKQAIVNIKEALDELKNENEDYAFKVEKIYNQIKKR
ncbi:KAP family NTPase [Aliarcobacter cryaerophilus]|uniref:KAP family NTPase n=1 Tax=Aliarcobacter cryaerophilus TaxID=28198 RepID=UPI0021B52171|nr:KAP family NTPase [Aliarcobacter cryaerophilus]MCT7509801.1 KAP family NTPase [Aliarcobacter cryaerophilus]